MIVKPTTGELIDENDLELLERHEETVDRYLRRLWPHYQFRRQLRERIAELRGPALLPGRRRDRSDAQYRVSTCPRCGEKN